MTFVCGVGGPGPTLAPVDYHARYLACCAGTAFTGDARRCTCWVPVYDLDQAEPQTGTQPDWHREMCGDCAYRPGSPERERGDDLLGLANFWCHRGIRRPRVWRHPDGRQRPGSASDYQPPIVEGVPYRADGRPAAQCAGWLQSRLMAELPA